MGGGQDGQGDFRGFSQWLLRLDQFRKVPLEPLGLLGGR